MANTLNLGNGNWATKKDSLLGYNSENNNYKPLPFDFSRGSTPDGSKATTINKDGLIETVGNNVPRIDYKDNTKGALLLEPSRSNIIAYSEDFSQSYWAKTNTTVISNASVSPDGTQNADKLNFTTSNGEIVKGMSFVSGQKYTMSFYAKTESGTLDFAYGNMDYGIISGTATTEWQRFEITQTLPATTRFPKIQTTEIGSLLLWGFQIEQGSYATSYIPTQGGAVTRLADVCNNGGNEQLFNDSEGVLYAEVSAFSNIPESNGGYIKISSPVVSFTNALILQQRNNGQLRVYFGGVGTSNIQFLVSNFDWISNNKIAVQYDSIGSNYKLFINGVSFSRYSSATNHSVVGLSQLDFKYSNTTFKGDVKDVRYYNTALTDQELQALTTI